MLSLLTPRRVVVGTNLVATLGIWAVMGRAGYGQFVLVWSMALLGGTVVSLGCPGWLRDELGASRDRGPLDMELVIWSMAGLPALLLCGAFGVFWALLETDHTLAAGHFEHPMLTSLALAYLVNMTMCLASILQVLGRPGLSLIFRDVLPLGTAFGVALALSLTGSATALHVLAGTAGCLLVLCACAAGFVLWVSVQAGLLCQQGRTRKLGCAVWMDGARRRGWIQLDLSTARLVGLVVYCAILLVVLGHVQPFAPTILALVIGTATLYLWAWAQARTDKGASPSLTRLVRA